MKLEKILQHAGTITFAAVLSSCASLEAEKTITIQNNTQDQHEEARIIEEQEPFYVLEHITTIPKARTGTRGEIPILAEGIPMLEEIDYSTQPIPVFGRKSLTLKDQEYHVNIDIIENQTTTIEGTYMLTFYKSKDVPETIPRIMYRIITNTEGEPIRANYQYFQQTILKIEEDEETKKRIIEIIPTRIIVHQNPFNTTYGTNPEDRVVTFSVIETPESSSKKWKEEIFMPKEEENPIPYDEAIRTLEREIDNLRITRNSCRNIIITARRIIQEQEETTLEEYLRRE